MKNKNGFIDSLKRYKILLLMLLPALIFVIVISYIPMGGIILAFKQYNYRDGLWGSPWNGLQNFKFLQISGKLGSLTFHTLTYNLLFITFGTAINVLFAIVINEMRIKWFKKISQTFMFLPYFISWVVVSALIMNIFGYEYGVLNNFLTSIGLERFDIYGSKQMWPAIMVLIYLWKQTGYGMVVYLASITGISPDYYEAAELDGANIFQKIWNITLPFLKGTIITMVLLALGNVFRGDFGMFYQIVKNNQNLLEVSDILDTFIYRSLMSSSDMGMTAAAGLFQSVLCFITIMLANKLVKRADPDYSLF